MHVVQKLIGAAESVVAGNFPTVNDDVIVITMETVLPLRVLINEFRWVRHVSHGWCP